MLLFGIGWAKPVPVNSRNFKNPRKGMACTAAAGPLVNLLLGFLSLAGLIFGTKIFLSANSDNMQLQALFSFFKAEYGSSYTSLLYVFLLNVVLNLSSGLKIVALLLYFLYISAMLNFMLAIFNLIPLPPFDGSRIAYVFLPAKYYFGVMKYERYIMIAFLIFFWFGSSFFSGAFEWLVNLLFRTMGWIL
ncbi:MAG: site-2 protease family protein [Clostridiales bacterium]|nr:site-2 protease family protein [Clostridiales bacterium]